MYSSATEKACKQSSLASMQAAAFDKQEACSRPGKAAGCSSTATACRASTAARSSTRAAGSHRTVNPQRHRSSSKAPCSSWQGNRHMQQHCCVQICSIPMEKESSSGYEWMGIELEQQVANLQHVVRLLEHLIGVQGRWVARTYQH